MQTAWLKILEHLRPTLRGQRDEHGHVGSLRWLEKQMEAKNANPHAVRNIIYREIGTAEDKSTLFQIITDLYEQNNMELPEPPEGARDVASSRVMKQASQLLGRQKKRAYRQFIAGIRTGRAPRMVVVGRNGVGKTILIDHLERSLRELGVQESYRLMLDGEIAPSLTSILELSGANAESLARLHSGLPFAVQASLQHEVARLIRERMEGKILLIRIGNAPNTIAGTQPRNALGESISLSRWVWENLFLPLQTTSTSVLLALSDPREVHPHYKGEVITLKPPTLEEARRFLTTRMPATPSEADRLIRQSGRNLEQLALIAGLSALGSGARVHDVRTVLSDPEVRSLLTVLAAAILPGESSAPRFVVEHALGRPLGTLPEVYRNLMDDTSSKTVRVVSRDLLPEVKKHLRTEELARTHRLASEAYARALETAREGEKAVFEERMLAHLARSGAWAEVIQWVSKHGERYGVLADAWARARRQVHGAVLESLARVVAGYYAALGQYAHPDARDAISVMLESNDTGARAWGRVKLAESAIDRAAYEAAQNLLNNQDIQDVLSGKETSEIARVTRAEAVLVQAALARWQGDLEAATRFVNLAVEYASEADSTLSNRTKLWRGLIMKDSGHWTEALNDLSAILDRDPLLYARARYQEGDLRLRLGQPFPAVTALKEAHDALESAGAALEERARVTARYATGLRRLGRISEAKTIMDEAERLSQGTDPVIQARVISEKAPIMLAMENFREGLRLAQAATQALRIGTERRQEAQYREWRASYRIGLAYLARGLGNPYLPPFPGPKFDHPDIEVARNILHRVLAEATPYTHTADRYTILITDILLNLAAAEPDATRALVHARRALELTNHSYAEAQVRATLADVYLRMNEADKALAEVNRAHALLRRAALGMQDPSNQTRPDPGVTSALISLEARALMQTEPDLKATLLWVKTAMQDPDLSGFKASVMREIGKALEDHADAAQAQKTLLEVFPQLKGCELSLRDALSMLV